MAEIRVMREDLRPPAPPPKRHFISIKDVTREDVERLLATARTFERSLEREVNVFQHQTKRKIGREIALHDEWSFIVHHSRTDH